jgi:hypothetical protein
MEKHFLADMMSGESAFKAEPWYNPYGDCVVYKIADEATVAERVDGLLTIYRSADDDRPIGFQIKGVRAIINRFGLEGLAFTSEIDAKSVKSVSIALLLLAAYEEGPYTLGRRMAYAAAMQYPSETQAISADELQLT